MDYKFYFLIAVPLGICAGIYLEEYGGKSKLASILEVNISNLSRSTICYIWTSWIRNFCQSFFNGK